MAGVIKDLLQLSVDKDLLLWLPDYWQNAIDTCKYTMKYRLLFVFLKHIAVFLFNTRLDTLTCSFSVFLQKKERMDVLLSLTSCIFL